MRHPNHAATGLNPHMLQQKALMIAGVFRSGTNAMRATLEANYYCLPRFNQYFWKHSLPPHSAASIIPPETGVICMIRNPIDWSRSLFKFWHTRRKELLPSSKVAKFIRDPLIVYDNSMGLDGIHYHFNSPIDYWNKYYYAWAFWKSMRNRVIFVRLEDFETQTESVLNLIEEKFSLIRRPTWHPALPSRRVGPFVPTSISGLDSDFSPSDHEFIIENCLPELKKLFKYCVDNHSM
jgi:hypothetical protein